MSVGGCECLCGGTHVKNVADIRGVTITKIKKVRHTMIFISSIILSSLLIE